MCDCEDLLTAIKDELVKANVSLDALVAAGGGGSEVPDVQLVQTKHGVTSGPTLNVTLDQTPQDGNSLIAVVQRVGNRGPVTLGGATADLISSAENGLRKVGVFGRHNIASATAACSVSDDDESAVSMQVFEVSGLTDTAAESTDNVTGNGNDISAGSVTPSSQANFVVGGIVGGGNGYTSGNIDPAESVTTFGSSCLYGFCIGYAIRANDASAIEMTRGLTIGGPWAGCSAAFGAA